MKIMTFFISSFVFFGFATEVSSWERKKAYAIVKNLTGEKISDVSLFHRFSCVYPETNKPGDNSYTWNAQLLPNEATEPPLKIDYNINDFVGPCGVMPEKANWWVVAWKSEKGVSYVSDPQNFRYFFDALEKNTAELAPKLVPLLLPSLLQGVSTSALELLVRVLLHPSVTVHPDYKISYKKCLLREDDADKVVTIELLAGNKIRIVPASTDACATNYTVVTENENNALDDLSLEVLKEAKKRIDEEIARKAKETEKPSEPTQSK